MTRLVTGVLLLSLLAIPCTSQAQDAYVPKGNLPLSAVADRVNWGVATTTINTTFSHDFELLQGVAGPPNIVTASVNCASGVCVWLAGVKLLSGVSIESVEFSGCDSDATQQIGFALFRTPKVPAGPVDVVPFQGTGVAQTPGCTTFVFVLPTPHTVDNANNTYVLDVAAPPGFNLEWNQFRVNYRIQVSPAPGTATFADVPVGHPFHRFVEALAQSGITGGCGGGNYCPNDPITRGQMAVFLAAALGLHFPN